MKKIIQKFSFLTLTTLLMLVVTNLQNTFAWESNWSVKSAVSRNDGTWLFPIASSNEYYLTDWAGCSANYYGQCIFGCSHANWGDSTHSSALGHFGLDIGCGNVPILASASGTVYHGYCSGRGNYLVIEHTLNNGSGLSYYSIYEHLNNFTVSNGANVSVGTQIGVAGNTGASFGTHLHFEILLLKSGLGSDLANTNTLYNYENQGWVTTSNRGTGLIVTNPGTTNYTSSSNCNMTYKAQWESIPYHCGSVTYTYNKSDVTIGLPKKSTSHATIDQAATWVSNRINKLATDIDNDKVCSNTDFIKEYSKFLGLDPLNGSPSSYSTMTLPNGYSRIKNWTGTDGFIPQKGDIGIWTGGSYGTSGKAGIILSADGWNITQLAEISTQGTQGNVKITSRADNYSNFWGVIRPNYASSITKRAVAFKNYDGSLLNMQIVPIGGTATAPSNPTRDNYAFMGWNGTFTNVTDDKTILPIYSLITTITPSPLKKLSAILYGYDDIKLSWTKSNNITGYAIYYKNNKDKPSYTLWKVTPNTSYKVPNLTDGLKYTFKVAPYRIIQGKVYWGTSLSVSKYTLKRVTTPTISKYSSTKTRICWNKVSGAQGYQISKSLLKSGTSIIKTVSSSNSNLVVTTKKNKTYYYKVRSYVTVNGKKIYGPWSTVKSYKLK